MTFTNAEGEQEKEDLTYNRHDFWATTSNKQLNFVQHIRTMLKSTAKRPSSARQRALRRAARAKPCAASCWRPPTVHTILRLPTGIFYAQGVKANVLFFDNKPSSKEPWTKEVWVYDYRTNIHHTLKKNPLNAKTCATSSPATTRPTATSARKPTTPATPKAAGGNSPTTELIARDKTSLDIFWLKDKPRRPRQPARPVSASPYGGYSVAVNASGCGPEDRGFKSHYSPSFVDR
jgi:type I restriction enzyme M protein